MAQLSEVNKKRRVEKCKKLRERFKYGRYLDILFTDEKLFSVECSFNRQNDRIICSTSKEISPVARVVKITQNLLLSWSGWDHSYWSDPPRIHLSRCQS